VPVGLEGNVYLLQPSSVGQLSGMLVQQDHHSTIGAIEVLEKPICFSNKRMLKVASRLPFARSST
jgi:hypothetical protein